MEGRKFRKVQRTEVTIPSKSCKGQVQKTEGVAKRKPRSLQGSEAM